MDKWGPVAKFLGVGFYIAFCIIFGILGGLWLDKLFHTEPIFLLLGLVIGLTAAFWGLYRMLVPYMNENKKGRK
jgi:ATP synthase protein I